MPSYDTAFFQYVNSGAIQSAERMLPVLLKALPIQSVLDVGCGQGAWLSVWRKLGVQITGLDGSYVDTAALLIPDTNFQAHDLTQGFTLAGRFDLVQSLEVAEHLPAASAPQFVASLTRHGDLVLFSAAPKGQGGDHHINEQNYDYWRALFAQQGFVAIDYIRPLVLRDAGIEPWYRYNTLLYVRAECFDRLPETLRRARIPQNRLVADFSPLPYRIRKSLTALLPIWTMTMLAKIKERMVASARARRVKEKVAR